MNWNKSWPLVVGLSCLLIGCGGGAAPETEAAPEAPAAAATPPAAEKPRFEQMSIEELQGWLSDNPEDVDGIHALGIALHADGRVDEALP